ncbi:MAG TPA: hypothetical protein VF660_07355, partial [Actinomycetota bacterium]
MLRRSLVASIALLPLIAGCRGTPGPEQTIVRRTTPPIALPPVPLEQPIQADLASGGYVARTFRPPFRFRVGSGWNRTY